MGSWTGKSVVRIRSSWTWTHTIPGWLLFFYYFLNLLSFVGAITTFHVLEEQKQGTIVGKINVNNGFKCSFDGNPTRFTIDSQSGIITTTKIIDRENLQVNPISLTIRLTDPNSQVSVQVQVQVQVDDINDNAPTFPTPYFTLQIPETTAVGVEFPINTATDQDLGNNGTVDYSIVSGNNAGKFTLGTSSSVCKRSELCVMTNNSIDRETVDFYQLNISAKDRGSPSRVGHYFVNITILDFNDNPPVFTSSVFDGSVAENTLPGHSILTVSASDKDIGLNGEVRFSIEKDAAKSDEIFDIDATSGIIRTKGSLDYETETSYTFKVIASDRGQPKESATTSININIIDQNDNPPYFYFVKYFPAGSSKAVVREDTKVPKMLAFIRITDDDSGANGEIQLDISEGNDLGHFVIEKDQKISGIYYLKVGHSLDREKTSFYNLTLNATDQGYPSKSVLAFASIEVSDINDNSPQFSSNSYTAHISEAAPNGSYVLKLNASDPDAGSNGTVSYSITSGNDLGWFQIDSKSGLVTTSMPIDREKLSSVTLTLTAQDHGPTPNSATTTLKINILDINDNPPVFQKSVYSKTIPEDTSQDTSIVKIIATDKDASENARITYAIDSDSQELNKHFILEPSSGILKTNGVLDRETKSFYRIPVTASDNGKTKLTSKATVDVTVSDINDNYPIFYPVVYFVSVVENGNPGRLVQVTATDQDYSSNAKVYYSIKSGNDNGSFTIDSNTGVISNVRSLDHEINGFHRLYINARDGGGQVALKSAVVEITVLNQADNPPRFEHTIYNFSVYENVPKGTLVGQVFATSKEKNITINYEIVSGDPTHLFIVNALGGIIMVDGAIDREVKPMYWLDIVAKMGQVRPLSTKTNVNITVLDKNDNAPKFARSNVQVNILGTWPVGRLISNESAIDKDAGTNGMVRYQLTKTANGLFKINTTSGVVTLARVVSKSDNLQYTVQVVASDLGSPPLHSNMAIHASILINHSPRFRSSSYVTHVLASRPLSYRFFIVSAVDNDSGKNGQLTYKIDQLGNQEELFGIFPDGFIYVKKNLIHAKKRSYDIVVRAVDSGTPRLSASVSVTIYIQDSDEHRSLFTNNTFRFSISENLVPGTLVGVITARATDSSRTKDIIYSLDSSNNVFAVDAKTGHITTRLMLDRESLVKASGGDDYMMRAEAVYNDTTVRRDSAIVIVTVNDVNDNPPYFSNALYGVKVSEALSPDSVVFKAIAEDPDSSSNSVISYSIIGGTGKGIFRINAANGDLYLNKKLDRETVDRYNLTLQATDTLNSNLSSLALVEISVEDSNDEMPIFQSYANNLRVSESVEIGSEIIDLNATDKDIGLNGLIVYSITCGNLAAVFDINHLTGRIFLAKSLDYETAHQYQLCITAQDRGSNPLSSVANLTINVLDANDNPPVFAAKPQQLQIVENITTGTLIGQCSASDKDSGSYGQIVYILEKQIPKGNMFTVDPLNCKISTAADIDREKMPNGLSFFQLVVKATDKAVPESGSLSSTKTINIQVIDVNDNKPRFISPSATPIGVSSFIMDIKAEDLDAGSNGMVTYSIVKGNSNNKFFLNSNNGKLEKPTPLSDNNLIYKLIVKAEDGGNPSLAVTTEITLFKTGPPGNGPKFSNSTFVGSITENQPIGTSVIRVDAAYSQNNLNTNIKYYITSDDSKASFSLNDTTGQITTKEQIDRESVGSVSKLIVFAVDMNGPQPKTSSVNVLITIHDINDNVPEFSNDKYITKVKENSPSGTSVLTLTASDIDEGENKNITYSITGGNHGNKFVIDSKSGKISTQGNLDRETKSEYTIKVTARDHGNPAKYSTCIVIATITDVNDHQPVFTKVYYSFSISEDASVGTTVGSVKAEDKDSGDNARLTYAILGLDSRVFALNSLSGIITLRQKLDREAVEHYVLNITATDNGQLVKYSTSVNVYMNVLDSNDNEPEFDQAFYHGDITEGASLLTQVTSVVAHDKDSGINGLINYSIVSGNTGDSFSILENGTIVNTKVLDREFKDAYVLTIQATDQSMPLASRQNGKTRVTINVTDVNDNRPHFTSASVAHVSENAYVNEVVLTIIAVDADQGSNSEILYSLIKIDLGAPFVLGSSDGVLRVSGALDRETKQNYTLKITATDKGNPSLSSHMQIVIVVDDYNDHAPIFLSHSSEIKILENVPPGTDIVNLLAVDSDDGTNAEIRYAIITGNDNGSFSINHITGRLRTAKMLDRETTPKHVLEIRAYDLGVPRKESVTTVTIVLRDINDNTPVFTKATYVTDVDENRIESSVVTVMAEDHDEGQDGEVTYGIVSGDVNGVFVINSRTGTIALTTALDREKKERYVLLVEAKDGGNPQRSARSTVVVNVADKNDNQPVFQHQTYEAKVKEGAAKGSFVIQVTAVDNDAGTNGNVKYSLVNDFGRFTIDSTSGRIVTDILLDREQIKYHPLEVLATDTGNPPLQAKANINVVIEDVNDHDPEFKNSLFKATVKENAVSGTIILVISANDKDKGVNAKSDYTITSGNGNGLFRLGKENGVIYVAKQVPLTSTPYTLQVKAANRNAPQRTATATVQISVSSGSFPSFLHKDQTIDVSELSPQGTRVLTVNATGHTSYFIAGGNDEDAFDIDAVFGVLRIKNSLNYEHLINYTLIIGAKDGSIPPHVAFIKVFIGVIDENDNTPVFSQNVYTARVQEDLPINSSVMAVKAADADSGINAVIEYSISLVDGPVYAFGISSSTGRLFTKQLLDHENTSTYSLKVRAENVGNRSMASEAVLNIVVTDVNDNVPVFAEPMVASVLENAPLGTFVTTIKAKDPDVDSDSLLRYEFLSNSNTDGVFMIDTRTGNMSVAKPLDRETRQTYILGVSVNDSKHVSTSSINVSVIDVNDNAPSFIAKPYSKLLPENSKVGTKVMNVTATDADSGTNAMIAYSIISKQHISYFHIDTKTGVLTLNKAVQFKRSAANVYNLTIRAKNIYPPNSQRDVNVEVEVLDTNDHAPVFTKPFYRFIVVRDSSIGVSVGTIEAQDKLDYGPNAIVRYEISSGNGSSKFRVVPETGDVRVKKDLNGDANKIYCIFVKAKDLGHPSMESVTQVCIDVTERNLYSPQFTNGLYQATAKEDKPLGSVVLTVTATDDDLGRNGHVFYSIASGDKKGYFGIGLTNGSIYVAKALDYESSPKNILNITATDGAKFFKTSSVSAEISLIDINDNNPVFDSDSYQCKLPENTPAMSRVVCTVHATDRDMQGKQDIQYYIAGGHGQAHFQIDKLTGEIRATTVFDFETTAKSLLLVGAKDLNLPPQRFANPRARVHIAITGKNEFVPVFVRDFFEGTVAENAPIGYSVLKVSATDKDAGPDGVVVYHLLGSDNFKGFALNSETGVLSISGKLDSEKSSKVTLKVIAKNLLQTDVTPSTIGHTTIIVTVTDANDAPRFLQSVYNARLPEGSSRGTYVANVTAIDDDDKERVIGSTILYGIGTGNTNQAFTIDSLSGVIKTAGDLDRESVPVYNLIVTATDNGIPPMTGNATVRVTLDDINDNPPRLSPADRVAFVLENQAPGTTVTTLTAVDSDADPNRGPYKFEISGTNYGKFQLDQSSGLLKTTIALDRETKDTYNLSVRVTDIGNLSAISYCLITVKDKNDNRPIATPRVVQVNTYNKRFPGGTVADVRPEDPDIDDVMTCGLLRTSSNMFSFPRGDCMLSSLANTGDGLHQLTINGSDGIGAVQYSVTLRFSGYTTDTVKQSVAVRLQNTTPKTFLSKSFNSFSQAVERILPQGFTSQVISVKGFDRGFVDILVASRKSNTFVYLEREKLAEYLKNNKNKIQTEGKVGIFNIDYTPCSTRSPCLNGGECSSEIQATGNTFVVNTIPLVFLSADFNWRYTCRCKPGFTGSKCEENMNDCDPNPCQHGGSCQKNLNNFKCVCPTGYTGTLCEIDIDECQSKPCQHFTRCKNIPGSYICECVTGYTGKTCSIDIDYCQAKPCLYNSTCVDRPTSFQCVCDYGGRGDRCQFSSLGFGVVSYMKFPTLRSKNQEQYNNVSLVFSTSTPDGLLFYNNDGTTDIDGDFIALEVVQGKVRFSYNLGFTANAAVISVDRVVNDGEWHRVTVIRDKKTAQVEVDSKFRNSGSVTGDFTKLELKSYPMYVGGVKDFDQALNDPRQHFKVFDFVGCIRDFYVNGEQIVAEKALESSGALDHCPHKAYCASNPCRHGGKCVDTWFDYYCECTQGYSGRNCDNEGSKAFRFSASSFLVLLFKESYRREQKLLDRPSPSVRSKRSVSSSDESFSISIRTRQEGLVMLAQDDTEDYTLVKVSSGAVNYEFKSGNRKDNLTLLLSTVMNGSWHNITVQRQGNSVILRVDTELKTKTFDRMPHKFLGKNVRTWSLGGVTNPPVGVKIPKFTGCIKQLNINDVNVPLNGPNKYLIAKAEGGAVGEGCGPGGACLSNPCTSDPNKSACVDEWFGYTCISDAPCKNKPCKNNGTCRSQKDGTFTCLCHANFTGELCGVCVGSPCVMIGKREEDSPYSVGLVAGIVFLVVVLVGIIVGVLAVKRNQKLKRESDYNAKHCDDICIPTDLQDGSQHASPSHSSDDSGVVIRNPSQKSNPDLRISPSNDDNKNIVIHKMGAPEDYQLKLHKSDERVDHGFSESDIGEFVMKNEFALKNGSGERLDYRGYPLKPSQRNQSIPNERGTPRQKPGLRDRKPPGPLVRQVLDRRHHGPPRTDPRMRAPYTNRHHKRSTNSVDTTSSEEQHEFSDVCPKSDNDNSERLDYYDIDVDSIGVSEASYQYEPSMFKDSISRRDLPAFSQHEIDRLRQASRNPPSGSFLDAISTSSEEAPTVDDKLSSMLDQVDTSSESSDDTFTCSEFECDERPMTRAEESDLHGSMVFSRLTSPGNTVTQQGSRNASQSTGDDEDLVIANRFAQKPNGTSEVFDWDDVLNWGLRYHNLRGVYKDIAELKDSIDENEEEYV